jgi:thiol:disulfide interchange protein
MPVAGESPVAVAESVSARGDFETSFFGTRMGFSGDAWYAIPLLLVFAFVGGFLLNMTPCVLPIIPIKIVGLTQATSGDAGRMKVLGISMGAGILVFWLAIGAAISFVSGFHSISSLFQQPLFGIAVGLFIAFMGIGMIIDLAVQLPQSVYRINPRHDTISGSFMFGVMTAVLSTPCTAPFMGSAAAWATRAGSAATVLMVFGAIACGMGWPYVLLSWFPGWLHRVPRTGPASVLVKQCMGLLMLAVAAFFGGTGLLGLLREQPHLGSVLHWWLATVLVGLMAVWLSVQSLRITRSPLKSVMWTGLGLLLFAGMVYWANGETADSAEALRLKTQENEAMRAYVASLETAVRNGQLDGPILMDAPVWRDFSAQALEQSRANGQVAIVHFTADW